MEQEKVQQNSSSQKPSKGRNRASEMYNDSQHSYERFMEGIEYQFLKKEVTPLRLSSHRAEVNSSWAVNHRRNIVDCQAMSLLHNGKVVNYRVDIGSFSFYINLLNRKTNVESSEDLICIGGFGEIYERNIATSKFISKVQRKSIKNKEITEVIVEVAIQKLCSLFCIGPAVETAIPFDLIVYDDAIEFFMEKCDPCQVAFKDYRGNFERDIKQCLLMLHRLRIAHKDIKPANILWSPQMNRYVLCDFGISVFSMASPGERQLTKCYGTENYMSNEMKSLGTKAGYVDLYYNDIFALSVTIKEVAKDESHYNYIPPHYEPGIIFEVGQQSFGSYQRSQHTIESSFQSKLKEFPDSFSSPSQPPPKATSNHKLKERSYEYFRVLFAATSPVEHQFGLKSNLTFLSEGQIRQIASILKNCHSIPKMMALLSEAEELGYKVQWIEYLEKIFVKNIENAGKYYPSPPLITSDTIENCIRVFDVQSQDQIQQIRGKIGKKGTGNEDLLRELRSLLKYLILIPQFRKLEDRQELISICEDICPLGEGNFNELFIRLMNNRPDSISRQFKEYAISDISRAHHRRNDEDMRYLELISDIITKKTDIHMAISSFLGDKSIDLHRRLFALLMKILNRPIFDQRLSDISEQIISEALRYHPFYACEVVYIKICISVPRTTLQKSLEIIDNSLNMISNTYGCVNIYLVDTLLTEKCKILQKTGNKEEYHQTTIKLAEHATQYALMLESEYLTMVFKENQSNDPSRTIQRGEITLQRQDSNFLFESMAQEYQTLAEKGDLRRAAELLLRLEQAASTEIEILRTKLYRADILLRTGLQQQALATVEEAEKDYKRLSSLSNEIKKLEWAMYDKKFQCQQRLRLYSKALESCRMLDRHLLNHPDTLDWNRGKAMLSYREGVCRLRLGEINGALELQYAAQSLYLEDNIIPYHLLNEVYRQIITMLVNKNQLQRAKEYAFKMIQWEKQGNLDRYETASIHSIMGLIYQKEGKQKEAVDHHWIALQWKPALIGDVIYKSFSAIYKFNRARTGKQLLSLASYSLENTSRPNPNQRRFISDEFYQRPVPTGILPYSISTSEFMEIAEQRLSTLSPSQNVACFCLKLRLCPIFGTKTHNEPIYGLLQIRTLIEAHLHLFVIAKSKIQRKFLMILFPKMLTKMQETKVSKEYESEKNLLLRYAWGFQGRLFVQ